MPSTQGWATAPTTLQALIRLVLERRPNTVLECGSGSSSVWLGYALQRIGHGRCVSLEHLPQYAEATRAMLRQHGLEDVVEVRLAPLTQVDHPELTSYLWYDTAAVSDLDDIGLVFVDGPPGDLAPLARFPAFPLLRERCTEDAVFLLDDTQRPDESAISAQWMKQFAAQPLTKGTFGTGWQSVSLGPRDAARTAGAS
ncbi:MAG TPA: class I SAM-dependent methyltransferase [Nocardioidaceae bacterium]|nr:class I SAM-dependent methyltransferase [Nocardioidaceae bacterium]